MVTFWRETLLYVAQLTHGLELGHTQDSSLLLQHFLFFQLPIVFPGLYYNIKKMKKERHYLSYYKLK